MPDMEKDFYYLLMIVRYQFEEGYLYLDEEESKRVDLLLSDWIEDYEESE